MKLYQQLQYKSKCHDFNIFKPSCLDIHASCVVNNNSIPDIFTFIKFCSFIDNGNSDNLPKSLLHLDLGDHFDNTVNNLPLKLLTLILGYSFNHYVDLLPEGLIKLSLGCRFNQKLDDLPSSLKILEINKNLEIFFGYNCTTLIYNYKINNLPGSINKILISENIKECFNEKYNDKIQINKKKVIY